MPKTVLLYDVDKDLPRSGILSSPNLVSQIKRLMVDGELNSLFLFTVTSV